MKRPLEQDKEEHEKFLLEKSGLSNAIDLSTLTKLNLPRCNLSSLPSELPSLVPNLSILFCPNNRFEELPALVGQCSKLQMVSFKDNGMKRVHPDALQPQLRWLILTGNAIETIPETIGRCSKLQKLMLSGNALKVLPESIDKLTSLELIRLACNDLQEPPMKLLRLPGLRWVALSRNPFLEDVISKRNQETLASLDDPVLIDTEWPILGQGAGGITRKVTWNEKFVAVKTFAGELTSDGSPQDERAISVAAASLEDPSLIKLLGQTVSAGSLVMEFLDGYEALAGPPSMASCSRDVYGDRTLSADIAWTIAKNLLRVLHKLHSEKAICHGDFYAHNILVNLDTQSVKLSDFGAAFFYDPDSDYGRLLQRVELRSYSVLVEELHGLASNTATEDSLLAWKTLIVACNEPNATFEGLLKHCT